MYNLSQGVKYRTGEGMGGKRIVYTFFDFFLNRPIFKYTPIFAVVSIYTMSFPSAEVINVVTPGPWPAVTQLLWTITPILIGPVLYVLPNV